eukprot:4744420-Amphidinium_carterae.1
MMCRAHCAPKCSHLVRQVVPPQERWRLEEQIRGASVNLAPTTSQAHQGRKQCTSSWVLLVFAVFLWCMQITELTAMAHSLLQQGA